MDLQIANWIYNTFGSNQTLLKIANVLTYLGDEITIILIIASLLIFKRTRKLGFYAAIAVMLAFVCNHFALKPIIARDRPYVTNPEFINALTLSGVKIPDSNSMPSGHSLASMALAISIFMFNKKFGIVSILLSVLCGITRMILCVHYLTDVLVGFAVGALFAIGCYYLLNFIIKKYLKRKETKNENNSVSNR